MGADAPAPTLDRDANVAVYATRNEVPRCTFTDFARVYYVHGDDQFYYCDGRNLRALDAVGEPGTDGLSWLIALSDASAAECANGGAVLYVGPDTDRNGTLDLAEISATEVICDGRPGEPGKPGKPGDNGKDGADGRDSLLEQKPEPPGSHCGHGGLRVDSGLDDDRDGKLDADEIEATNYLCHGASAAVCRPDEAQCAEGGDLVCVDLSQDPNHCGGCNNACPSTNDSEPVCVDGACSVSPPPDLTPVAEQALVMKRAADACEVAEGCVGGTGERIRIAFDTVIWNLGEGPLVLGEPGGPGWEDLECRQQHRRVNFVRYELLAGSTVVAQTDYPAYCTEDSEIYDADAGPARFSCSFQGLSPHWGTRVGARTPCQGIDVTQVPPGKYVLRVTVNPDHTLFESDYANNVFEMPVGI